MTPEGDRVAAWKMDNWNYVERQVVTDPHGRQWSVGLMDILGQEGDPEMPGHLLEAQYQAGRYFTLIYSDAGAIQHERPYRSLPEATQEFERLLKAVFDGSYDPSQPVFRANLDD
jgi:hypothetical protein